MWLERQQWGEPFGWLTSLRMAHTAESLSTESRSAMIGLKEGSTAPSATPFSKWPERSSTQEGLWVYFIICTVSAQIIAQKPQQGPC